MDEDPLTAAGTRVRAALAGAELGRLSTLGALCVVSAIKGADLQLLPASFRAMEVDLSLRPYCLGMLALSQGVACAAAGPIWGNLVDSGFSRRRLIMTGTGCWGVCTFSLAFVSSFPKMAVLRALNGVWLAMLLPVTQSFVADMSHKSERGYLFGWLYFFSNMGQVLACLFVTPLSMQQVYGYDGWRVALAVVGMLSLFVMMFIPYFIQEECRAWKPERLGLQREFRKLGRFMQIPTFAVIILQGIFGTIPGAALSFSTMYFQYTGISDTTVALINSLRIVGDACGGLLGGIIGDGLALRSPSYGRAMTAQISMVACLPLVYVIFLGLNRSEASAGSYAGLLFLHGLVGSWMAPGCLCPIMCDIIPKRCLGSAYAWELALVFASGNTMGPLLVGTMAQRLFGYKLSTEEVGEMPPDRRGQNAEALGMSLLFASAVPYAICAVLCSLMYLTYPGDTRAASESNLSDECTSSDGDPGSLPPTETTRLVANGMRPKVPRTVY